VASLGDGIFDINYDDVPDVNLRNLTQNTDRTGKAISGNIYQVKNINYNDIPDINLRNLTQNTDRTGKAMTGNIYQSKVINYNDIPDMPMKAMQNYNDVGPMQHTNDNTYVINYEDMTPNVTNREITGSTNRINPARTEVGYDRSRRDIYSGRVNVGKDEVGQTGRTPTLISYDKGYTTKFNSSYPDKEKLNIQNRIGIPGAILQTTDKLPFNFDKNKNETYYVNTRINSFVNENLEGNPYINNIVAKSIIKY
jgi:hypothetical protein